MQSPKFLVQIELANAIFADDEQTATLEVVRLLRQIANTLEASETLGFSGSTVRDINGNTCGHYGEFF